jgi:hypothetical protein
VLTFANNKIAAVEPGEAFHPAEWEDVSREIEGAILAGAPKTGRDYSFSTFPVLGSWRGRHSGVQILPAFDDAPRAAGVSNPFILEFPIKGSDLCSSPITGASVSIEGSPSCSTSCLPETQVCHRPKGEKLSGHTSLAMSNPLAGFDCCSPVFYQDCAAIGEAPAPIHRISGGFRNITTRR